MLVVTLDIGLVLKRKMRKNDICLSCNCNCIDVDDIWIQCPECNKRYVRSSVNEDEYASACPSASIISRAYNPIMGASTVDQIKELREEGYSAVGSDIFFGRRW